MTPKQRWLIIGGLLLATLGAGLMIDEPPAPAKADRGEKSARSARSAAAAGAQRRASDPGQAAAAAPSTAPLSFPDPVAIAAPADGAVIDPFRPKTWVVAPPPPPPVKPVAPALPFAYLGKVSEGSEVRVFLNDQGKYLIAQVGDVINGLYTVEEIAGSRMTFVYQPLNEKQVLAIGSER